MQTVSEIKELRRQIRGWRAAGERIAIVPTMGNLHEGHISLIRVAKQNADRVVVTVFVNPTQFGPTEDFDSYPRTLAADARKLAAVRADLLFAPGVNVVYPFGVENATRVIVPNLTDTLCGASRPGHFDGVTSVVARLFLLVQPDVAVFGQKDYQQQLVLRHMVDDLGLQIKVLMAPIVRDSDGLAMSSRNSYLEQEQRKAATTVYRQLCAVAAHLRDGRRDFAALQERAVESLAESVDCVDYVAIRRAEDLAPADAESQQVVILAAAFVGSVRLIDNVLVNLT